MKKINEINQCEKYPVEEINETLKQTYYIASAREDNRIRNLAEWLQNYDG